ncbi:colipase-like protein 2 [Cricetulus griseus]|uniref:Colipase-like protein C6orf126-like n=1 Tax=Cricetulus griseus TaxID=10029 RepID=G3HZU5_CRIGR|nr:colipase-like protein 2 [Cricetulus griseus]EGW03620.1 Colipase-like protein C6orf126-like [Cricetulus griseus]
MAFTRALATMLALLTGVQPHVFSETSEYKKANGDRCVHHNQCFSDCCLIDLERRGAFCTSKSRMGMECLPQTRGTLNFVCPCRIGLSCPSKEPMCPRRCQMI